jgi:hypothetical protein
MACRGDMKKPEQNRETSTHGGMIACRALARPYEGKERHYRTPYYRPIPRRYHAENDTITA